MAHLLLHLLQFLHGGHAAGHTRHSRHATAATETLLGGLTLAVLALAALGLLFRGGAAAAHARHAELAGHARHHLLRLVEALDKGVDLRDGHARTVGNALAARGVEDLGILTLFGGHTADNCLDAVELLFVDHVSHLRHLLAARHHLEQVADGAHLADHEHLVKEVVERHLARADLRCGLLGLLVVEGGLSLLDEGEQVAHTEDAARHALRVEDVEVVELLAGRCKKNGLAGDLTDGQRGTTAGVAIELGEHDTGEVHAVTEGLGSLDGVLADHRVDDEEDFIWVHSVADIASLRHERFVDTEAAGGIDDDHVVLGALGFLDTGLGDGNRVAVGGAHLVLAGVDGRAGVRREGGHAGALAHDLELLDRARTLEVTGHEHGRVSVLRQVLGELAGERRLTGTLKAGEHDDGGRVLRELEATRLAAEDLHEFLVDDLDHLLGRVERLGDLGASGALLDALDKAADDGQRDVGLEQREADFAGRRVDIGLGQLALAAQPGEGGL